MAHTAVRPRQSFHAAASEFLGKKRIAVTGVSRPPQGHGSNLVYQRLRDSANGANVQWLELRAREMSRRSFHGGWVVPGRHFG